MMGGDLTVTSSVGIGSDFCFSFEAAPAPEGWVPAAPRSSGNLRLAPEYLGTRVLIVDDIMTNREVLADLLTRTGFDIRMAASGEEGIRVHDVWKPQLVLMDLRMAGMGGIEAIQRLRQGGSRSVVVALTASALPESRDEVLKAGGNDLLLKPYREKELLNAICKLMGVQYAAPEAATLVGPPVPKESADLAPLADLLRDAPAELLQQLREAAIEARVERIEKLAAQLRTYSAPAAEQIGTLARNFQYEDLLSALETPLPK